MHDILGVRSQNPLQPTSHTYPIQYLLPRLGLVLQSLHRIEKTMKGTNEYHEVSLPKAGLHLLS